MSTLSKTPYLRIRLFAHSVDMEGSLFSQTPNER